MRSRPCAGTCAGGSRCESTQAPVINPADAVRGSDLGCAGYTRAGDFSTTIERLGPSLADTYAGHRCRQHQSRNRQSAPVKSFGRGAGATLSSPGNPMAGRRALRRGLCRCRSFSKAQRGCLRHCLARNVNAGLCAEFLHCVEKLGAKGSGTRSCGS